MRKEWQMSPSLSIQEDLRSDFAPMVTKFGSLCRVQIRMCFGSAVLGKIMSLRESERKIHLHLDFRMFCDFRSLFFVLLDSQTSLSCYHVVESYGIVTRSFGEQINQLY